MTSLGSAVTQVLVALAAVFAALSPAPASAPAAAQSYVALGDSYTAGPAVPNQLPDPLGCLRSDRNYPHLVAPALTQTLRDVSCSGATTDDFLAPQPVLGGPNPPQLDAVHRDAGTVSMQIGGNDIGFLEIIVRCASPLPQGTPCQDVYVRNGTDEISRRIAATATKVAAALAEVHRRGPRARVLVLGYPSILPDDRPGCWPVLPITPADVGYLRAKEKELNAMLADQAAAAGATYVDVYGPSVGHDACQPPGTRWVEPLVPLAPAAPVHPNALGMRGMADALLAAPAAGEHR
jgi:lysophospholipase L1-like esterase